MGIMIGELEHQAVLDALRNHVALAADVSDALTVLQDRERKSLSVALSEARDLAGRLQPREDGEHQSQQDLENWLGAVLRGPHDGKWFDERVRSRLRGWAHLPAVTNALIIGRVRLRLTEIATLTSAKLNQGGERITDALARLFDLELVLVHFDLEVTNATTATFTEVDPLRSLTAEASLNIRDAIHVIDTSAYLVRHYCEQFVDGNTNIDRHLNRISKHAERANLEVGRLLDAARPPFHPAN